MADLALVIVNDAIAIGVFVFGSKILARLMGERYGYYKEDDRG